MQTTRTKYPRTYHLPWSEGITDDDHIIGSLDAFNDQRVIVTEKMDGENTTLYQDYSHARSLDSRHHPSRDWVKQFWGQICTDIPKNWRICGENLYAKHSIHYHQLPSYFMGFSIWDGCNVCLGWDETLDWFKLIGITPVPVLYDGIFNEKLIRDLSKTINQTRQEGYVLRTAETITYEEFNQKVAKYVRKGHLQTTQDWGKGQIECNHLVCI